MSASIGEPCYGKAVPGAYGSVVLGRVRDDVKSILGGVLEQALRQALIKHVGIDLASPDDEVRDGDRVLLPGGDAEKLPDGAGYSPADVDNLVEVLGIDVGDLDTSAPGAMSRVTVLASELRVRLGGVLQSLTGDGCDDIVDGVQDLEKWLKDGSVRELYKSITRKEPVEGESITELLSEASETWEGASRSLGEYTGYLSAVRAALIAFTSRDPGTDLSTQEILKLTLEDYSRECERRQATQDRVQSLLLRLVGECGEGLTTETMLDRIEQTLGPVPEF